MGGGEAARLTIVRAGDASRSAGDIRRVASVAERRDTSCRTAAEDDASRSTTAPLDASHPRLCAWCDRPIPATARRDAVCCSVRCRQARHRFLRTVGSAPQAVEGGRPLRLAYADPPYPGNARLYRGHRDYAGEVDHGALIARLLTYDGWALSTSAGALPAVLALCPPTVRVAAWHRGERPTVSRWPLNAWEPVIYVQGRPANPSCRTSATRRVDSLVHGVSPMTTLPGRVIGAKPAAFCRWIFDLLGAQPGDSLDDLFPGSGAVSRAWAAFTGLADPSHQCSDDASVPAGRDASGERQPSCPPAYATASLLSSTSTELTRERT
ncbi:hypothetical protein [[Actinomadura] parvosata]|uniref:hypothetical protein n=1 Tax=[Actinomadura] parvosata TaxID=1955412 RepID=UPI0012BBE1DC|nr:hypothetical protein [Nonomuraea sp. ATCC 55076]